MGAWEDGFAAGFRAGRREESAMADDAYRAYVGKEGAMSSARRAKGPRRKRTPSAYSKRLGTALRRIRKKAIKKDGDFRKGWSNKKIMRLAHKEARK
jgi:hypothetical protein